MTTKQIQPTEVDSGPNYFAATGTNAGGAYWLRAEPSGTLPAKQLHAATKGKAARPTAEKKTGLRRAMEIFRAYTADEEPRL